MGCRPGCPRSPRSAGPGEPDDIGGAIASLLTGENSWITGQRIEASGVCGSETPDAGDYWWQCPPAVLGGTSSAGLRSKKPTGFRVKPV